MPVRVVLGTLVLAGLPLVAKADWPQFRGPGGLGVSNEKGLPIVWSEQKNIRWKIALPGRGLSSPVIAGPPFQEQLYLTACTGWQQDRLHVLCLDPRTGKKRWERQFTGTGTTVCHEKTNMAAPTPVTDGQHVFALFATHDLAALDRDGNLLWFRSLTGDYPTVGNNVGMASSPVLAGDTLVLALENAGESFVVGIDKITGKNRWRVPRPRGINWTTPAVLQQGQQTVVVLQSPDELSAHNVESGKKVWTLTDVKLSTIPSPVVAQGRVFAPGPEFLAVRPGSTERQPEILWRTRKLPGGYSSPVVYEGKVYMLTARGILNCADAAAGNPLWDVRLDGNYAASPVAADGRIYAVNEEGVTTVLQAQDGKLLAINPLPEKFLASPVIWESALYLRSDRALYCISEK